MKRGRKCEGEGKEEDAPTAKMHSCLLHMTCAQVSVSWEGGKCTAIWQYAKWPFSPTYLDTETSLVNEGAFPSISTVA